MGRPSCGMIAGLRRQLEQLQQAHRSTGWRSGIEALDRLLLGGGLPERMVGRTGQRGRFSEFVVCRG